MVKHGGGSIRIAQKMYKKMLKEILLKSTQDLRLEQRFSFQSSNDSKHNQDNAGVASGQVWESGETWKQQCSQSNMKEFCKEEWLEIHKSRCPKACIIIPKKI